MKVPFFKSRHRTPTEIVRLTREILVEFHLNWTSLSNSKQHDKMRDLSKWLRELKEVLYGKGESEPVPDACLRLTEDFFKDNTTRLLIVCLPKLSLEARNEATQIVANLQRQQVHSRLIASDYLEANKDLLDCLVAGYDDMDIALHSGAMLRECVRHQSIARYVLESEHMKKFFDYIQVPYFDIGSDAAATFKELLIRHKSTAAEFFEKNYDWFFQDFNSKLLKSDTYITRRQAIKLLKEILQDRANSAITTRYISSKDNLMILMNLLKESSKTIPMEAFHVFKLFSGNQNKPPEIDHVLCLNKSKLLKFFGNFIPEKEDETFETDKVQVIKEIAALKQKS